jgi:beta-N-acetylhexosaminidase
LEKTTNNSFSAAIAEIMSGYHGPLLAIISALAILIGLFYTSFHKPAELQAQTADISENELDRLVGELFLIGFRGSSISDAGLSTLRQILSDGRAAGVVFLSRNLPEPDDPEYVDKIVRLTSLIRRSSPGMPIIAVDQEGGYVQRLKGPLEALPAPSILGRIEDRKTARTVTRNAGLAAARQLKRLGFNVNFSPVLDIYREEEPRGDLDGGRNDMSLMLKSRSFGGDPDLVGDLGVEMIKAHLEEGVMPCAKHFPGHGVTGVDSHRDVPTVSVSTARMADSDIVPFWMAIRNGVPLVMVSHVVNIRLDPLFPASLSQRVMNDFLRRELGFDGIIITDDLTMDAVRKQPGGSAVSAVHALKSGADLLILAWRDYEYPPAFLTVKQAVRTGELPVTRVREAAGRVREFREKLENIRDSFSNQSSRQIVTIPIGGP